MQHERAVFDKLSEARGALARAKSVGERAEAEGMLTRALGQFFAVAEAYPDLKANQSFLQLQSRISELENQIADRREFYNDTVTTFNTRIQQIPDSMVADWLSLQPAELFKVDGSGSPGRRRSRSSPPPPESRLHSVGKSTALRRARRRAMRCRPWPLRRSHGRLRQCLPCPGAPRTRRSDHDQRFRFRFEVVRDSRGRGSLPRGGGGTRPSRRRARAGARHDRARHGGGAGRSALDGAPQCQGNGFSRSHLRRPRPAADQAERGRGVRMRPGG